MDFENMNRHSNLTTETNGVDDVSMYYIIVGGVFGFLVTGISIVTMIILVRCKKLVRQVRFLSIHLTVTNMGYGITIIIISIYYAVSGTLCASLYKILPVFIVTYYLFLTCIGLDRLFALKFPMDYTFWSCERKSFTLAVLLYCLGIILNIPNMSHNFDFKCLGGPRLMFSYTGLICFVVTLQVLLLVEIMTYLYIGHLVIRFMAKKFEASTRKRQSNDYGRYIKITIKSLNLCILTALLLGPFIAARCIDLAEFTDSQLNIGQLTTPSIFLSFVHQIASPIFILCSYKECRYIMLSFLFSFNGERQRALQEDYRQYYASYDISPEKNSQTVHTQQIN